MAVSIFTGVPGMGKTALIVMMLLKNERLTHKARPVFVMGIPDLKIDHSKCPPVEQWTEQRPDPDDPSLMLDYFTFPPDSILIVDESQKVYRNRASTTKVPAIVAALETHRHTGIDIWLLTQKPKQLDSAVREIAGQHIHIRNTIFFGRRLYEWPEYRDVNTEANFKDAAIRKFSPPKEAFQYYKSSELHTKQSRRIHNVFFFLPVAIAFTLYNGWGIFSKIFSKNLEQVDPITKMAEVKNTKPDLTTIPAAEKKQDPAVDTPAPEPVHPFIGFDFIIKATINSARYNRTYYEITNGEKTVFMNDQELKDIGYSISQTTDCAAFLFFKGASVVAACSTGDNLTAARQRRGGVVTTNTPQEDNAPYYTPRPMLDGSDFPPSPA